MFSVCPHLGGVPISHNALQHYPEFHGADTWGGTWPGPARGGYPAWGYPARGHPVGGVLCQGYPAGGYPVRTTEGVLTTRRAVCLLRSRRRTFLLLLVLILSLLPILQISNVALTNRNLLHEVNENLSKVKVITNVSLHCLKKIIERKMFAAT